MRFFSKRVLLVGAVVFLLFILSALVQEMNRRMQVQKEVARLEQEVRSLDKAVMEMSNLNQYFRSEAYKERMAREKLNYRAPGEEVVLLPDERSVGDEAREDTEKIVKLSIPMHWWRIFFVEQFNSDIIN